MSHATGSVSSRIVEVVINAQFSRAITLGKRRASVAFASASRSPCSSISSAEAAQERDDDSDFDGSEDEAGEDDTGESETEEGGFQPPGSESPSKRLYHCTQQNCTKSYTKPSRLAEHQRSHTGERPYVCLTCNKSYLRESHLQAHVRSHLPASERPFPCTEETCPKRFWTTQHLNVHIASVHNKEKPFKCIQEGCEDQFAKHNQLRRHVADMHSPPGTKPYLCTAQGCDKSFPTNQKLRKHSKVHEGNRYACANPICDVTTASGTSSPLYFPNWTGLQLHIRDHHPPTCPHLECKGRTFTSHKGLKGHLKVHEQKETEDALEGAVATDERPKKRRRGGEVGRDWKCDLDNCLKTFKSKKALTTHNNVTHLGHRDHVCPYPPCGKTFGYKHLLQRHTSRVHAPTDPLTQAPPARSENVESSSMIGWITGTDYTSSSTHRNTRRALVPCPWPDRFEFEDLNADEALQVQGNIRQCTFVFSRAYDLRRHLKADHGLDLTKDLMDRWVTNWRDRHVEIP